MIHVLLYLMTFAAGFLACDLVRIAQERYRLRQVVRFAVQTSGSPDKVLRVWSTHRKNWCSCPRCQGRWGR